MVYLMTYDLCAPGRNYDELYRAIESTVPTHWHCLESNWILVTSLTVAQIRDCLTPHIDTNDKLLVVKLTGDAAWYGLTTEGSAWLKQVLEARAAA